HGALAAAGAARPAADPPALPRRHSARPVRRTVVLARFALVIASGPLRHAGGNRLLPRGAAAGAADLRLCGTAVRRHSPVTARRSRDLVLSQHLELLRRDL